MKTRNLFLILIFGITSTVFSQSFYDINTINTIEVTFEESNWDYLLDQLVSAGNEGRLMGSVSINGQAYDSVGIRYKGNSSYRANQVKNPLNIKLDYIIDDQEIEGYGTLKLANVYKDPSFVREALSYEIARKYFPASEANYANIYVNGTHLGLYTNVQDVDKFFMRTHFGSDETVRAKGEIESNAMPGQMGGVWEYYGTDSTDYADYYEMESDHGWAKLVEFIDTLNNHNAYVDQVLNIDRHLWFLAFSNLIVNLDGPINNPQNYYLFEDGNGRFNPIPWDLNESFGVFTTLQSGGNLSTYQLQHLSHVVNLTNSDYPIIRRILSNDTYRKMYVAHMKTMLEDNISNGWYETRALEIQDIIDEDVQNDSHKFYTYSNFTSNINNSVGGGGWPPSSGIIGITQLMDSRASYLSNLSEFEAQAPEITNINYSPEVVSPNTELWFSSTVNSVNQVYLAYRQSSTAVFEKVEMFDDGNHNDGSAGDGVYGISIVTGSSDIQYYIYAKNNSAAAFSPPNAEYEFYSIEINSTLVINEFMADNESTVMDQDGEYDDWIEIFNTGESALAIDGYYLSDDAAEPDQWSFPDTSIAAGGYLIVWADKDEEQEGLHANFKLSKSGESIILSNPAISVVDETTFDQQITDSTTGRFPNGTGDFVQMPPTFGAKNSMTAIVNYDDLAINEFMADNETTVTDQNGEYDDWIEIYNNGTEELAMMGMYLSNDAAVPGQWTFPDTSLAPGEYLIVWADNDEEQEGLHANFTLSQSGGIILLSDPDLNIVDEFTYGEQISDISTGRYPNGIGDFMEMLPTFAAENEITNSGQFGDLLINEFMADNETTVTDQDGEYDDWIEIYNKGSEELAIHNLYLSDDLTNPGQWTFPDTVIGAGAYLVVWADKDEEQEGLHANFKLSKSGESIILSDPFLDMVDEFTFGEQFTDTTMGRFPNGTGDFELMPPSFSAENQSFVSLSQTIALSDGWSGISSYLVPDNVMVEAIFDELTNEDDLIILQNFSTMYWPAANLNTIDQNGGWDSESGYMLKVDGNQEIVIDGTSATNQTLTFDEAGWYLIPVLSSCNVSVNELFEDVVDDLVIIKEVAGTSVYWPGVVQTLFSLETGKSYFVKFDNPASITFPECTDATKSTGKSVNAYHSINWDNAAPKPGSHIILVDAHALSGFPEGSEVGVFTEGGICTGAAIIHQTDEAIVLVCYPDDETTTAKDGFVVGDAMVFKVFYSEIMQEEIINVEAYNQYLPDASGLYNLNGVSEIKSFQILSSINESMDQLKVFPNPTNGYVQITGLSDDTKEVTVMDVLGNKVLAVPQSQLHENIKLDLSVLPKGVYVINIKSLSTSASRKIMIR